MAERQRSQLVIGLGEGAKGRLFREGLDRAAESAGKPVTVWARELLVLAAASTVSPGDDLLLTISLGKGVEADQLHFALSRAAAYAKKPLVLWARESLLIAAGPRRFRASSR